MGTLEDYETKLPEITIIGDEDLVTNINIPIDVYIQEAENLYKWCQEDKTTLTTTGLTWKTVDDIPLRAGALREAESRWVTKRFTKKETAQWKEQSTKVFEMRNFLLHEFRFAYRNETYLLGRINKRSSSYFSSSNSKK